MLGFCLLGLLLAMLPQTDRILLAGPSAAALRAAFFGSHDLAECTIHIQPARRHKVRLHRSEIDGYFAQLGCPAASVNVLKSLETEPFLSAELYHACF